MTRALRANAEFKRCSKCGELKPRDAFYTGARNGISAKCKECCKALSLERKKAMRAARPSMPIDREWREIQFARGYFVSDRGDVWMQKYLKNRCPGMLRGELGKNRYRRVKINGRQWLVHRLICWAFNGAPPTNTHQAAHWDGDRLNNQAKNLRWASSKENCADTVRHGRTNRGSKAHHAKLSDASVREIKRRLVRGDRGASLAREFGVTPTCISAINTGQAWAWL